jgi:hypothetical protein
LGFLCCEGQGNKTTSIGMVVLNWQVTKEIRNKKGA